MSPVHKIELFSHDGHKYHFRPLGGNGEILYTSQAYANRWNAKRAANRLHPGVEVVSAPR